MLPPLTSLAARDLMHDRTPGRQKQRIVHDALIERDKIV
jgi:hypothetical protein